MEYTVEDISPVKKKISVAVTPEEVNAAIKGSIAVLKDSVKLDGFRKGKVPAAVIEKKFHNEIYNEARENLINVHINDILQKLDLKPLSGLNISGDNIPLEKDKPYDYTIEFEILPIFDLPNYEGLAVEEEKAEVNVEAVNAIIDKIRNDTARLVPVEGSAPAKDGQVVNIDFEAFENGEPVKDLKVTNFTLELGRQEALPDFETLVKSIPAGHTSEGQVAFPADFLNPEMAGKTLTMRVTVNSVKEKQLPELDEKFAKKLGKESVEDFKEMIGKSYTKTLGEMHKSEAQKKLLDQLLKMTDFPLPQTLVDLELRMIITDMAAQLEQQGRTLNSLGKSLPELMEEYRPRAEEMARNQVLLMAIARKENLEVSDEEVLKDIYNNCARSGADFKNTVESMQKSGMIFHLKDRMLADKAMDLVYSRANVTMVDPKDKSAGPETPAGDKQEAEAVTAAAAEVEENEEK